MFVVTLPAAASADPGAFADRAAAAGADLLEIRGDLSPRPAAFVSPLPVILAPRGADPRPLLAAVGAATRHLDLEDGEPLPEPLPEGIRILRSRHDHEGMPAPERLETWGRERRREGAATIKIAVRPRRADELLQLGRLRRRLAAEGPVVVTAMGPLASFDRLLGVSDNAFTYAALDAASRAAPGQLELAEHLRLRGRGRPRLFAVLGGPDLRSRSPLIHNGLFRDHDLAAHYGACPGDDLAVNFRALAELGVEGFSITSPFKRAILPLVDELDPLAERLGSVNTAVRVGDRWRGYQTDVVGIRRGHPEFAGRREVAVVGSGGVVPAVLEALRGLGVGRLVVHARDERARAGLARDFGVEALPLEDLAQRELDLLVWTLPVDLPGLDLPRPRPGAIAFDLRYRDHEGFLGRAAALGYAGLDGARMLVVQALAQFEIFTGETASSRDLERSLTRLREARD
ncbi:MAG: type I 3-dehydroquinate dehydratase [Planctomycetes bacterium]|nr:type I 3-dehydroquinate dehydratase [Planctomycetota bacterium]